MSETEGDRAKPPRFPYVAALLCAACVGAAGWTWMRYSYCWDISAHDWERSRPWLVPHVLAEGRLVRLWAALDGPAYEMPDGSIEADLLHPYVERRLACIRFRVFRSGPVAWVLDSEGRRILLRRHGDHAARVRAESTFVGRAYDEPTDTVPTRLLDTTASRLTGASVAGFAVGAMGVFVFAVALRHWLRERAPR